MEDLVINLLARLLMEHPRVAVVVVTIAGVSLTVGNIWKAFPLAWRTWLEARAPRAIAIVRAVYKAPIVADMLRAVRQFVDGKAKLGAPTAYPPPFLDGTLDFAASRRAMHDTIDAALSDMAAAAVLPASLRSLPVAPISDASAAHPAPPSLPVPK